MRCGAPFSKAVFLRLTSRARSTGPQLRLNIITLNRPVVRSNVDGTQNELVPIPPQPGAGQLGSTPVGQGQAEAVLRCGPGRVGHMGSWRLVLLQHCWGCWPQGADMVSLGWGLGRDKQAHQCPRGPDGLWGLGKKFQTINQRGEKPYSWSISPHLELRSIRKIKINMIFL